MTIVADDDPDEPYRLCEGCARRVRARALRPIEWFNLASLHGWQKHLLHDDFYDEDGEAQQPEIPVAKSGRPAPTLAEAASDPDRLLAFAVTRWHFDDDLIAALRSHAPQPLLTAITARAAAGNPGIFAVMLEVAAVAVGPFAADWVRGEYARARASLAMFSWCQAAAACLPLDEGLSLALAAVTPDDGGPAGEIKSCLIWFRSARVLDWIEAHAPPANVAQSWGRLAAFSDFDLDRANRWVASGRPLNMIAVDALAEFLPYPGMAPVTRLLEPALQRCASRSAVLDVLHAARGGDPSVRITRIADAIEARIDRLRIAPVTKP